jgi:hypothetical protein
VWWARADAASGGLIGEPVPLSLTQVAEELGGEGGTWAHFVTRKLQHDLGGRLADAGDAALVADGDGFDAGMAEADRLAAKIAMIFRDLHGISDQRRTTP